MDRLSSCYFCGIALDEPLRDYPLAPGDGDPNAVVTLCPTCRRKLETVLGTVSSPSDEDPEETAIVTEEAAQLDASGADPEALGANAPDVDEEPIVMGTEETSAVDESEAEETESSESDATDDGEVDGTDATDDSDASPAASGRGKSPAADDTDTFETVETADVTAAAESAAADGEDGGADDGADGESELAGQPDEGEPDAPEDLQTGETSDDETGSESDDGSSEGDGVKTTVSALEYNKVMRLLQNREFPVDRAEIVAVAANAYELSKSECGEVIDLAVDRGLVDQEDGRLVRADD